MLKKNLKYINIYIDFQINIFIINIIYYIHIEILYKM